MKTHTAKYTAKAHQWLALLAQVGFATSEGFGNSVCRCRRNGWCEWVMDENGMVRSGGYVLEKITDTGLAKLKEWDETPND